MHIYESIQYAALVGGDHVLDVDESILPSYLSVPTVLKSPKSSPLNSSVSFGRIRSYLQYFYLSFGRC